MHSNSRNSIQLSSKFATTYNRLLTSGLGAVPDISRFWQDVLALPVESEFLRSNLQRLSKDQCLGPLKATCNSLFSSCLATIRETSQNEATKTNALETLLIFTRCMLEKNLSGWEIMEIFAGGVNRSDEVFLTLTSCTNDVMADESVPATIRHQTLQLAIIFVCGISQLSPVAYFLRKDLYPSINTFMQSPATEQFAFEAVMFFSVLANYHKSDAAKLNPYMLRIKDMDDVAFMRKMWWASNFALEASIKSYQEIMDDSPPTLASSIGSLVASMRPDRALASKPVDLPRDLFKNQPVEATVIMLPIHDSLRTNPLFHGVMLQYSSSESNVSTHPPPSSTILTLSSYLLCHASSSSSPRAVAYAHLSLNVLLAFSENDEVMGAFSQPCKKAIRLCRQRLPDLPVLPSSSPAICSLLDCCVLWLRHNLHMKLEVFLYSTCISICQRTIQFLLRNGTRLVYHWTELWKSIFGLFGFLSSKLDNLTTTGGIERLIKQAIDLLYTALCNIEKLLPTPRSIHEFIYELIRSSPAIKKQPEILRTLQPVPSPPPEKLAHILSVIDYYEEKVSKSGSRTANGSMRAVSKEVEKDGVWGAKGTEEELDNWSSSKDVFNFSRYVCLDTLALMP